MVFNMGDFEPQLTQDPNQLAVLDASRIGYRLSERLTVTPEHLQEVQRRIAALWLPDVEAVANLVQQSAQKVAAGEKPLVIVIVGPSHGMGKSRLFLPMLEARLEQLYPGQSVGLMVSPLDDEGKSFDFFYEENFGGKRGVVVIDEGSFFGDDGRVIEPIVRGINGRTMATVWLVPNNYNQAERVAAFDRISKQIGTHGAEVVRYDAQMKGVPKALAKELLSCFRPGSDEEDVYLKIIDAMQVIPPRLLTEMLTNRPEWFVDQAIKARNGHRYIYDVDFETVARILGFNDDDIEYYRSQTNKPID